MHLRILTDSLIKSSLQIDTTISRAAVITVAVPVVRRVKNTVKVDTIKPAIKTTPVKRKKLFGRIIEAFASQKKVKGTGQPAQQPGIVKTNTTTQTTISAQPGKNQPASKRVREKLHLVGSRQLYNVNNSLKSNERDLLFINNNLIAQIIITLKKYKVAEQNYMEASKVDLQGNLMDAFSEIKRASNIIIAFLIIIIITILYNIWKIFKNQKAIITYSENAENYALSKSKFLANMSHEIRTPLNSVIGFSEQLSKSRLTDTQQEQVNAIGTSSKMLLEVVNEILDFSKYETGKMNFEHTAFMPYDVITDIFNTIKIQSDKKDIRFESDINFDKNICFVGDSMRLKQVIMNLLSNAIKFTHSGHITLQARLIATTVNHSTIRIKVTDTGIGIDKDHQALIFDEFAQITSAQKIARHQGTGLGLAICKKIVELQGGSISVTSVLGKGSIFKFELPFEITDSKNCVVETAPSQSDAAGKLNGKNVLIAEDNKFNVLLVTTILKKWKVKYDIAYDGAEALNLYQQNKYDLLLTDIEMPEMDGIQLARFIRNSSEDLQRYMPILALTANVLKEDRDKYMDAGINEVVLNRF